MAVDMFIKIGDLKGEAQDQKHKDEIDILSWSWGVSNNGTAHMGGGCRLWQSARSRPSFHKMDGQSFPRLLLACCSGKHFPEASLTVRKAGEKPVEYCKIKLEQVLISSVSTGGSHGTEDRLTEQVSLNFATVNVHYTPQDASGKPGTAIPMGWDIAKHKQA